jgi:hypothetical protein
MKEEDSDFEKISAKELENYWKAVIDNKVNLLTQLSNGSTVALIPVERKNAQLFVTHQGALPDKDTNILISFNALKDRLFFKTQLSKSTDGRHFIDVFGDLFRLQRRDNFRITIPDNISLPCLINQIGDANVKVKSARIVDLSLGGALIEIPEWEKSINTGDWIAGSIAPEKEAAIQFKGNVKHCRDFKNSSKKRLGVQFEKLVGNGLNELNKLVMKYYHKMFSKFSNF